MRAPATSANLGPGFDCAAVALDLWNELEVAEGDADPDPEQLVVRAFGLVGDPTGFELRLHSRIPQKRGLGSSASVIALGLVAGSLVNGDSVDPERLLALGAPLEGHSDNLAAALAGGVCVTWQGRIARIADELPLAAVAVIPASRVSTARARAALPEQVPHGDAAFTAARATLLGAAIARGDAELFAAALDDRLHEPYRAANAPLLAEIRADLPPGAAGATLSGSGPTVIVWAHDADACARSLAGQFPDADVTPLAVAQSGAAPL